MVGGGVVGVVGTVGAVGAGVGASVVGALVGDEVDNISNSNIVVRLFGIIVAFDVSVAKQIENQVYYKFASIVKNLDKPLFSQRL